MLHVVTFFPSWLPASSSPVAAPSLERGKLVTVAHSLTRAVVVVVVVVVLVLVVVARATIEDEAKLQKALAKIVQRSVD